MAALRAKDLCPTPYGESLAIPTWKYGQEPTTPFATAYAKYFQNSIREEALVAKSKTGIVYARGGGGTVREVFQDVEENYYAENADQFTPMVFFDPKGYWENRVEIDPETGKVRREGVKLDDTLPDVFRLSRARHGDAEQCLRKVRFTVDFEEIVQLLQGHQGVAQERLAQLLAGRAGTDHVFSTWS